MPNVEIKKWRGNEVQKLAELEMAKRIQACAILLTNDIKASISLPSNHGATPSAPGEPPHKDTGRLRASIAWFFDPKALTARVGTNLLVGKWLELGTRFMAARPYIRAAWYRNLDRIQRILSGG